MVSASETYQKANIVTEHQDLGLTDLIVASASLIEVTDECSFAYESILITDKILLQNRKKNGETAVYHSLPPMATQISTCVHFSHIEHSLELWFSVSIGIHPDWLFA